MERRDGIEFGVRALDWLALRQDLFDPRYEWSSDREARMKAYIELVFLLCQLMRSQLARRDRRVSELANFAFAVAQEVDMEALSNKEPLALAGLGIIEDFCSLFRGAPGPYHAVLEHLVKAGMDELLDRVPFRLMELRYTLERTDIVVPTELLPGMAELYQRTVAAQAPLLPYLTTMDVYSITHTVFYLTDMGHRRADELVPGASRHLQYPLSRLLGMTVRSRNLDLAGELLMCHSFLRMPPSAVTSATWRALREGQLTSGAVPSPSYNKHAVSVLRGEQELHYDFEHCYHTTLVAVGATFAWAEFTENQSTYSGSYLGDVGTGQSYLYL